MKTKILVALGVFLASSILFYRASGAVSPSILSISPACMDLGAPAPVVSLAGSGFKGNSYIVVNGTPRTTYAPSSTVRQVQLTAADVAVAGNLSIQVVNPKPSPVYSNAMLFGVVEPQLEVLTTSLPDATEGVPYFYQLQAGHLSLCSGQMLP